MPKIAVITYTSDSDWNYESSTTIIQQSITDWVEISNEDLATLQAARRKGMLINGQYWCILEYVDSVTVKQTVEDYVEYVKKEQKRIEQSKLDKEERRKERAKLLRKEKEEREKALLEELSKKYGKNG